MTTVSAARRSDKAASWESLGRFAVVVWACAFDPSYTATRVRSSHEASVAVQALRLLEPVLNGSTPRVRAAHHQPLLLYSRTVSAAILPSWNREIGGSIRSRHSGHMPERPPAIFSMSVIGSVHREQ